jgi:serine protease AprX
MTAESRLPLKRVILTDSDVYRQKPGGSPPHIFGPVTHKERSDVSNKIVAVQRHFKQDFVAYPDLPAVAKILLKEEALAKTHRPSSILEKAGCRIIGVGNSGELLVSVSERTLSALEHAVMTESSDLSLANISTIASIDAFAVDDTQLAELKTAATLKLRLFRHYDTRIDKAIETKFLEYVRAERIEFEELMYARSLSIFRLREFRPSHVRALARFVGTQSLGSFPKYHVVRPAAQQVGKLTGVSEHARSWAESSFGAGWLMATAADRGARVGAPVDVGSAM